MCVQLAVGGWMGPHCLQNDKVEVAGKLPAITESKKILPPPLSPPLSAFLYPHLPFPTLAHSVSIFHFSLSIIVFINIYQC